MNLTEIIFRIFLFLFYILFVGCFLFLFIVIPIFCLIILAMACINILGVEGFIFWLIISIFSLILCRLVYVKFLEGGYW